MNSSAHKIVVFGAGHLANVLFKSITPNQYQIQATSKSGRTYNGIKSFQWEIGDQFPSEMWDEADCILWAIPPKENYLLSLKKAHKKFTKKTPWIFISSTSVYLSGNISESSVRDGNQFLIDIENNLKDMDRKISIIRPSGLVDEKRHPKIFFKNSLEVKGGLNRANLVHTEDVARFIEFVIKHEYFGEDFNLVSDTNCSKKDFYSSFYGQNLKFLDEKVLDKIIQNDKSKSVGFKYWYPNLKDFFKC